MNTHINKQAYIISLFFALYFSLPLCLMTSVACVHIYTEIYIKRACSARSFRKSQSIICEAPRRRTISGQLSLDVGVRSSIDLCLSLALCYVIAVCTFFLFICARLSFQLQKASSRMTGHSFYQRARACGRICAVCCPGFIHETVFVFEASP